MTRPYVQYHRETDSDDDSCNQIKSVSCMGRQPGSEVFVFGPNLQFSSEGHIIPPSEQEYVWIPDIMKRSNCVINPITSIPEIQLPLKHVTEGLLKLSGQNLPSALFVAGIALNRY